MFLLVSFASQENGIAVTTGTPSTTVAEPFPETEVETIGAAVTAGELEGPSASLEAAGEPLTASAVD